MADLVVIGGGLAGCEAAWQAAQRGLIVDLYEMRPDVKTGAHISDKLAELVCSNSLGSNQPDRAAGLLKQELRGMGSLLISCADATALPAGSALAVDRVEFARAVSDAIAGNSRIRVIRKEVVAIPDGLVIIASGPLTYDRLAGSIRELTGVQQLHFYDAIAPIVLADSIDLAIAYRGSRYGHGELKEGDYINCPMSKDEYLAFIDALTSAERMQLRDFEGEIGKGVVTGAGDYFEGCLPIEVQANRGPEALEYGPLRSVGLVDPRSGRMPYATVQLRQDNIAGTLYNIVGFQTNLLYFEQKRVFRKIPGLQNAEFVRYGQMHRNTFLNSPVLLRPSLQYNRRADLFFAGQITGVEGYVGNIATGMLAGMNTARLVRGEEILDLPRTTMLGALCYYITHARPENFQPMKANLGILPPLEGQGKRKMTKQERGLEFANRSLACLGEFLSKKGERWPN